MNPPFAHHPYRTHQPESMEITGADSNDRAQPVPCLNPNLSLSNPRYEDPVLPEQIDRAQQIPSFPPHTVNAIPHASRIPEPPKRNTQITQNVAINKAPALIQPTFNTPKMHEDLIETLTCLICKDIFLDPVVSTCSCAITICRDCSVKNKSKCPTCRQRTNYQPNRIVKELVGKIPYNCACGISFKRDDKEKHEKQCPQIIRYCGLCKFNGNRGQLLDHLYEKHYLNIFYYFAEPVQDRVVSRN